MENMLFQGCIHQEKNIPEEMFIKKLWRRQFVWLNSVPIQRVYNNYK